MSHRTAKSPTLKFDQDPRKRDVKVFEEFGNAIENRWRDKNYNETAFPDIAAQALAEAKLNERVTAWDTIRWVQSIPQLPIQHDIEGKFGNPPITLYSGRRFYIDIYFWVDGTTAIHQHGFDGAFQVLLGSSIHSRYTFQQQHAINDRFLLGEVIFNDSELLTEGDIRKIFAGREFIHALFHLDRPSATITVRTYDAVKAKPQYSYLKPHIAFDPFFKETSTIKKLQSVSLLLSVDHPDTEAMIGDLLGSLDFQSTFFVLQAIYFLGTNELDKVMGLSKGRDRFNRLLGKARHRHDQFADIIPLVLEEQEREDDLVKRRSAITAREHRFFLALMLNVPSRAKVLDLIHKFLPSRDPIDTVMDWVTELSSIKVWGSREPNVLGIKDFTDDYLPILQCMLKGFSPKQTKDFLKKEYSGKHGRELERQANEISRQLKASPVFRGIFGSETST